MRIFKKNGPILMGILNLTPDSFSDGGKFNTLKKALHQAEKLEKDGADIIDIGGESTGPGSKNISEKEELKRVISILKELRKHTKIPISIDTYKAEVARQALEEGVDMINDVTSFRGDKNMASVIADYKCPIILMYSKDNTPRTTIKNKKYKNITLTINNFLKKRIKYAKNHGIKQNQVILDPGMGHFISAIPRYSYEVIKNLPQLAKEFPKNPILIGISRKSLLGDPIESRDERGKSLSALAYLNGARIIRTHDPKGLKTYLSYVISEQSGILP